MIPNALYTLSSIDEIKWSCCSVRIHTYEICLFLTFVPSIYQEIIPIKKKWWCDHKRQSVCDAIICNIKNLINKSLSLWWSDAIACTPSIIWYYKEIVQLPISHYRHVTNYSKATINQVVFLLELFVYDRVLLHDFFYWFDIIQRSNATNKEIIFTPFILGWPKNIANDGDYFIVG